MMKEYEALEISVIAFDSEDIIITSGGAEEPEPGTIYTPDV